MFLLSHMSESNAPNLLCRQTSNRLINVTNNSNMSKNNNIPTGILFWAENWNWINIFWLRSRSSTFKLFRQKLKEHKNKKPDSFLCRVWFDSFCLTSLWKHNPRHITISANKIWTEYSSSYATCCGRYRTKNICR